MVENKLQEHINNDTKQILDLHAKSLLVANKEMGEIKIDISAVKSDVSWLIWAVRWIVGGIGTSIFLALMNLAISLLKK